MKKVVDCDPVGYGILVELLSSQEVMGTNLHIQGKAKVGAPQAYILKIGAFVNEEKEYPFKVGDRVLLSGAYTPVPEIKRENERELGIVEPHAIKAILKERSDLEVLEVR
jgi:co-chaperonin GroES (HSP10)